MLKGKKNNNKNLSNIERKKDIKLELKKGQQKIVFHFFVIGEFL